MRSYVTTFAVLALSVVIVFVPNRADALQQSVIYAGPPGLQSKPSGAMAKANTALRRALVAFETGSPLRMAENRIRVERGNILLEVKASDGSGTLLAQLRNLGMNREQVFGNMISGWFPLGRVRQLVALDGVVAASALLTPLSNNGLVDSEGVAAMKVDKLHDPLVGLDGAGVSIGVISNSYNQLGDAATDVINDDLPAGVNVLDDSANCGGFPLPLPCPDEGRGMMQLVYDTAPGADQLFHTAFPSQSAFAQGILDLDLAGADIIVDDILYFAEPFFQDGIIAQAVDTVAANGTMYFSSAGNMARMSYENAYVNSGVELDDGFRSLGFLHDFDPGAGPGNVNPLQRFSIAEGETLLMTLQWDQPFGSPAAGNGSASDYDIYVVETSGDPWIICGKSDADNVGTGDPVEVLQFTALAALGCPGGDYDIIISRFSGPDAGTLKWVNFAGFNHNFAWDVTASTTYGHANAAGAVSVGASYYLETPVFDDRGYPGCELLVPECILELEFFSSAGGTPIIFDTNSTLLPAPVVRQKPWIVGPDGTNTTFFGSDRDGNGWPNFSGTSASAPHLAGVAALLLEAYPTATPAEIFTALADSALEMGPDGFDFDTGHGFVDAEAALMAMGGDPGPDPDPTPVNTAPVAVDEQYSMGKNSTLVVAAPGVLENDTDPEGDPLTAHLVVGPAAGEGVLIFGADGGVSYTPVQNFTGKIDFTYTARDDSGEDSNIATLTFNVTKGKGGGGGGADDGGTGGGGTDPTWCDAHPNNKKCQI